MRCRWCGHGDWDRCDYVGVARIAPAGDRLVVPHDAYGGSWRLFNALAQKGHFELITVDLTVSCTNEDMDSQVMVYLTARGSEEGMELSPLVVMNAQY